MTLRVTFKHEDEVDGQIIGPVRLIDVEEAAKDKRLSVPFGEMPRGTTDLGWQTLAKAREIASDHGVELEEW